MNWFTKAIIFKGLSTIHGGTSIYRYAQWNWTNSIVATPNRVSQKLDVGMGYLNWLLNHEHTLEQIRGMCHMDLGSGWHPTIPLLLSRIGLRNQVLVDINPLMTYDTLRDAVTLVNELVDHPNHPANPLIKEKTLPDPSGHEDLQSLLDQFSMTYQAPYLKWAATTEVRFDLVTCTQVLMHIDRPLLDKVFKLVHDLLKPGGLFMVPVHLFDIYSNSDPNISIYNHLRYSKRFWRSVVCSDIMSFNRLKSPDFREALEGAGFHILEFEIERGGPADLEMLRTLDIHPEFSSRYTEEELSEKHLFFVARRP